MRDQLAGRDRIPIVSGSIGSRVRKGHDRDIIDLPERLQAQLLCDSGLSGSVASPRRSRGCARTPSCPPPNRRGIGIGGQGQHQLG
jgi:hypothetical protein